jgi:2-amino-4-hydroxy-6-hydroxymethyldihydropteridine diphosphokinase
MRHGRHGDPRRVLAAAAPALAAGGLQLLAVAPSRETSPLGPSRRRFANGAVLGLWNGSAEALLALCHQVERAFGRRRRRRWGPRVLDCDLLLIESEVARPRGRVRPRLVLPHAELHRRPFVVEPLAFLWPGWRHPLLNLTPRHLRFRQMKPRPAEQSRPLRT